MVGQGYEKNHLPNPFILLSQYGHDSYIVFAELEAGLLGNIRKLVLDVLKPHKPDIIEYCDRLSDNKRITGVSIFLNEVDQETENIKVIVEGVNLSYEKIRNVIEDLSGSIHSIDAVYAGEEIIDEVDTPQDR